MDNNPRKNLLFICLSMATFFLMTIMFIPLTYEDSRAETGDWKRLDEGLYLGRFDPKKKSMICNQKIIILKIDPKFYSLKLLSASEYGVRSRTARQWCKEFNLVATINASMYQNRDLLKSTGYMKNYSHFNNPHINNNFGSLMVFNPIDPSLPKVQIIDRRLQKEWKSLIKRYNTVVQNYRMISDGKKRGWQKQGQIHSAAAIGMDRDDRVLFVLSRSPYSIHDFIHILLSLPIHIRDAMYVEGGPEATLHLSVDGRDKTILGICEEGVSESDKEWGSEIPNVIGILRRR